MEHNCERHTFEVADGQCRSCLGSFCTDCLIYPFGAGKPPYCKPCAIAAGGIRSTAGNPRRNLDPPEPRREGRRGLLGRLRRGSETAEDRPALTPEELIEREAEEARRLLDAQRLPTAAEEEPEEPPPPTPNIAPPGRVDDEPELLHREMPDEIAGGLDLSNAARAEGAVELPTSKRAEAPAWTKPEPTPTPTPTPTSERGTEDADPPRPDPPHDDDVPVGATAWTDTRAGRTPPTSDGSEPNATGPEPAPDDLAALATTTTDHQAGGQSGTIAGNRTADGVQLFADASATGHAPAGPGAERDAPTPAAGRTATSGITAEEISELRRRIADLKRV